MLDLDKRLVAGVASPVTGHLQLQLRKMESQFVIMFPDGHLLGVVNAQLEKALGNIEEQRLQLEFEVFVPTRNTREIIGKAERGQEAIVRVQINIYGPRASADSVGQELSQNKVYLQRPDYVREGADYDNPHVLKFPDDCEPVSIANVSVEEPTVGKPAAESFQKIISNIYSSLTRNENLVGLEGHERLRTSLLE